MPGVLSRENDPHHPITRLIKELNKTDEQSRVNAAKNLSVFALALGVERTRSELIPFLTQSKYNEHHVLVAFAEQLGTFTPLVGGPNYVHCLLAPLENLATVGKYFIRNRAVESLKNLCELHSDSAVEQYFVPMVKRLAEGNCFRPKTSACGLFCVCYSRLSSDLKEDMKKVFKKLCKDDSSLVRQIALKHLGEFAGVVELDYVKCDLMPVLDDLIQDKQDSIDLWAMEACISISKFLTQADVEQLIVPILHRAGAEAALQYV